MSKIKKTSFPKCIFLSLYFFLIIFLLSYTATAQTKGGTVKNTVVQRAVTGNTYAIIFGVSNYPGLTPLKYADKDAELFRDFLTTPAGGGAKLENIFYRTNENAKAAAFNIEAYGWLKSKNLKEGDRLYIYFSGHGDAMNEDNYFLLPYDCTPNNDVNNYLATGRIEMYHVKTLFVKPLIAKKIEVLLIVDACRTNDLPGGQVGQQSFVADVQSIAEQKEGEIIMLSAGAGQSAIESPKIGNGHGLFTWYLVAGLSGDADKEGDAADHDGKVSLEELTSYVKNRVRKEAKSLFNADQVPVFLPPDRDLETIAMVDSGTYNTWKMTEAMLQQTNGNSMAVVNKKAGKKAVIPGTAADTALISIDNKFIAAIKSGKLSGKNSAEEFYDQMLHKWPGQTITEDARYSLATEYINFGQEKINLYLSGKGITHIEHMESAYTGNKKMSHVKDKDSVKNVPVAIEEQIVRMKNVASTGYDKAAEMMEKAVELLKADPELLESVYPKLFFLKASSLQFSSNTIKKRQAIAFVKKAIDKDVTAAYNYELLADLYNDTGNDSCKIYYQKAIGLAPKWAYPENGLGNFYNDKRDYKQAMEHYNNAIRLDSLDEFVYQNIGSMYQNSGKADSAKKYYFRALSIDPCDFYANANIGSLYKDSITDVQKSSHFFNLSHKCLLKAITCNPNYAWAYNKLAQLYDVVNKKDSSIYYIKLGIDRNPDNGSLYRSLANEYFFQKDTTNAGKYYSQAVLIDSLDINNFTTLGWFYRRIGVNARSKFNPDKNITLDKSISYYRKALQIDPMSTIAFNNLGVDYNELKMHDKAILYYQKTINIDSTYVLAYNNLGNIYYDQKEYEKAILNYKKAIQFDPTFTLPYYNLGLIYDNLKAYDNAVLYYKKSIDRDSSDASVFVSLANVYYEQKFYDSAVKYYKKAAVVDSLNTTALVYLADTYRKLQENDKAIMNYRKALRIDSNSTYTYNELGNVYFDQKQYDKAVISYQKAIHLNAAYYSAYYNLGLIYYNEKDYDKSILFYNKAITLGDSTDKTSYNALADAYFNKKNYNEAILNYKAALKLDSGYVKVYNNVGNVYYAEKDYNDAMPYYVKTIKLDPGYTAAYYNIALIKENDKNYDDALLYYQKAIASDSAYSSAFLATGNIYYNQGKFDKAILNYQTVARLEPNNPKAFFYMGDTYQEQKIYDKAVLNYKKAISLDSTYTAAYNDLGNTYYDQKLYDQAIFNYQKAIRLDNKYVPAYRNIGLVYYDLKEYNKAIENYQKAIQADSLNAASYVSLGNIYNDEKSYDKAILNYHKAVVIDSTYGLAYNDLGLVYDELKDFGKSIPEYLKAVKLEPTNTTFVTNLGYAYIYNGDLKNGIPYLEQVLAKNPDDPWSYYNLACAWSIGTDSGKGIGYLKNALEKGYKDYDHIQTDQDISNLRKTPEFVQLMKQYFPDKSK